MSATGYKNVYKTWSPYGKPFVVAIKIKKQNIHVGYYSTVQEGHAAAIAFRKAVAMFDILERFKST